VLCCTVLYYTMLCYAMLCCAVLIRLDSLDRCLAAQQTAQVQDFQSPVASTNIGPDPLFPDFDLICEG
jgi:hypothetical protein